MPRLIKDSGSDKLRLFAFHGVELTLVLGSSQAVGDCPFCTKEGKLFADPSTTKWDCKVCGASGNDRSFLAQYWKSCRDSMGAAAAERKQKQAARTECDQEAASQRLMDDGIVMTRVNHAVIGAMGEIGELAGAIEKHIYYGQTFDRINFKEEIGDVLWYIALACNALGFDLGEVMEANLRKLKVRFPDQYDEQRVREENRDRQAEYGEIFNTCRDHAWEVILNETGIGRRCNRCKKTEVAC